MQVDFQKILCNSEETGRDRLRKQQTNQGQDLDLNNNIETKLHSRIKYNPG